MRSFDFTADLQNKKVDVSLVNSASGYLSWRRFQHQVLLVEGASVESSETSFQAQLLTLNGTPSDSSTATSPVPSFPLSQFKTKRLCARAFFTSESAILLAQAQSDASTGFPTVAPASTDISFSRVDSCSSSFTRSFEGFFGDTTTENAGAGPGCVPPFSPDAAGFCSSCDIKDAAQAQSMFPRLEATSDCEMGRGTTYTQALRRLTAGVCDMALVRSSTVQEECLGKDEKVVPSWCPSSPTTAYV